jgi:hypothetical protein
MPELPGHERREERRGERKERREERRGSEERAEKVEEAKANLKARLVKWGQEFTAAEVENGEAELEMVPSAPEPPVGNQVVDQELEGDYTLAGE